MSSSKAIYQLAKELKINNSQLLELCDDLGIYAKGASKRLSEEEISKINNYISSKDVSELKSDSIISDKTVIIQDKTHKKEKFHYFPNRLMR